MVEENKSLIKVNSGLLAALHEGALSINVMQKDTLILETLIAGTSFRILDNVEPELSSEVKLELKREKNEYDVFAIALFYKTHKVGYIPREHNQIIARLLDAGKSFYAILHAKQWQNQWLRLDIKVFLND